MLALFFLLLLISIPMWLWLCFCIGKINPSAGKLSLLIFPGMYWAHQLWHHPEAKIRLAACANLVLFLLTVYVGFKLPDDWMRTLILGPEYTQRKRLAENKQKYAAKERWCLEEHEAHYDPGLGTCVELSKKEILAQGIDTAALARLTTHLGKSGIQGELDLSQTSVGIKLSKSTEIAKVASYYFLPFSMSQPEISIIVCVSASACTNFLEKIKDHSIINMARNNNLLLAIPWDALEDYRIKELTAAFLDFKS